jgi:spermidine/putrescine transport system permease protein
MGFNLGMFTVILAHISFCVPYAIVAIYPRMNKMNMNHILASYDLGHSKMDTFMKITVPYLLPAILSGAAIAFAMSLDDFIITNLVNGSFQTIATLIYNSRKGIKAWIVTFGALVVIITLIVVVIASVTKFIKLKRNQQHKITGLRS